MEIKVKNEGDLTRATYYNPATEETIEEVVLQPGAEVTFTAVNAHEPGDVQVGEIVPPGEAKSEGSE